MELLFQQHGPYGGHIMAGATPAALQGGGNMMNGMMAAMPPPHRMGGTPWATPMMGGMGGGMALGPQGRATPGPAVQGGGYERNGLPPAAQQHNNRYTPSPPTALLGRNMHSASASFILANNCRAAIDSWCNGGMDDKVLHANLQTNLDMYVLGGGSVADGIMGRTARGGGAAAEATPPTWQTRANKVSGHGDDVLYLGAMPYDVLLPPPSPLLPPPYMHNYSSWEPSHQGWLWTSAPIPGT